MEERNFEQSASQNNPNLEKHEFGVDVNQILDIMIKSVYSSTEFFMRELISNSSDACDKLKSLYFQLQEEGLELEPINSLNIEVMADKEKKTLTIKDNGLGMTKSDLINFIGTIASSGTRKFKEAMEEKGNTKDISSLIGQFGLGFYSAYLVAEKVDIVTRHPRDEAVVWSSTGKNDYTIQAYEGEGFLHGTEIILHLKEGQMEYIETKRIKELIKKYSSFVKYPIYLYVEKQAGKTEDQKTDSTDDQEEENKEEQQASKITIEKELVNFQKPVWDRALKDVSDEELKDLYKTISGDWDTFQAVDMWHIEGFLSVKLLLFIPKRSRMDMFNKNTKKNGIKLYCANVFVSDDLKDCIPDWMNFVVGVISSNDISMNISRELIQGSNLYKLIKKTLPNKVLDMIKKLASDEEKYAGFIKEFGNCMKLAVSEIQDTQQEMFANTLRYYTTYSPDKLTGLEGYYSRMKEDQNQIYVVTGLNKEQVRNNPFLDAFRDYEVIFMDDAVDEVMLRGLKTYKGKSLQRITAEGVEIPGQENVVEGEYDNFVNTVKEILGEGVEKVTINKALNSVPCVISTTKYSHSSAMETIMKSQLMAETNPLMALSAMSKKIFEINPTHPITKNMMKMVENDNKQELEKIVKLLYNTSLLSCGFYLQDPNSFTKMIFGLIEGQEPVVEEPVVEPVVGQEEEINVSN